MSVVAQVTHPEPAFDPMEMLRIGLTALSTPAPQRLLGEMRSAGAPQIPAAATRFLIEAARGSKVQRSPRSSNGETVITNGGIHDEEALNIYTDGSSFPGKKRAAGVGVVLMWVDEAGNPQTSEHAPSGYQSATIDEMEIQACTVGLQEAKRVFPDLSRFTKILLFSDSKYVTENFFKAMNIWPQKGWRGANGTPVENIDLWKRLRKEVKTCALRVDVRWVKGHKSNIYNRAADKLAKQSAAMPFNKPLSISQTTRKWSNLTTQRGCVAFDGRLVRIRIISTEYKKYAREYEYRFEVVDPDDPFYKDVDFVRYKHLLSRNKCLLVRLNSDQDHPHIEEVLEELDPDDYRY